MSWWELPEPEASKLGGKRWLRSDGAEFEADFAKSVEAEEAATAESTSNAGGGRR